MVSSDHSSFFKNTVLSNDYIKTQEKLIRLIFLRNWLKTELEKINKKIRDLEE